MSPPWSYVNVASNVPVRERHIFKTSTEGRQLRKHARRRKADGLGGLRAESRKDRRGGVMGRDVKYWI